MEQPYRRGRPSRRSDDALLPVDAEFCVIAEGGMLATQAVLLCKSIRRFGGRFADAPITVVSPRFDRRPDAGRRKQFAALGADYVELDLRSPVPEYGPSFKVLSLAARARAGGPRTLVQLDSDTVFLCEPDLRGDDDAAARPVDVVGMGSAGQGDPSEALWQRMAELCGADLDAIPFVETTVDRKRIRANYNGGLIAAPRAFFSGVDTCFRRIVEGGIRPYDFRHHGMRTGAGEVSAEGMRWWGTTQAAISLAAARMNLAMRTLGADHNIPVHMAEALDTPRPAITHVHYHWLYHELAGPLLDHPALPFTDEQRGWLRDQVVEV